MQEKFVLLSLKSSVSLKTGKPYYYAIIYSTTYCYTDRIFLTEEQYLSLSSIPSNDLMSYDINPHLTKVVHNNVPSLRLSDLL